MNERMNLSQYNGAERRAPSVDPRVFEPGFVNRRKASKAAGRHAAITTQLSNWHSYRNWAYKTRGSWQEK